MTMEPGANLLGREPVGILDLAGLPRRWRHLDFLHERALGMSQQGGSAVITPRQVDQARLGGHRLYPNVERALGAARDCDLALRSLLEHHGASQVAMWALLRTQFEGAFWALWLLDPEGSADRVVRGIGFEWRDDRASVTYFKEFADDEGFPFVDEDRKRLRQQAADDHAGTFRAEAAGNGCSWDKPPTVNMTVELTRLRWVQQPGWGSMLRGVWRSLAGLQHGSTGALLRVSDQTVLEPIKGGSRMLISPRDDAFHHLADTTVTLHLAALARFIECHSPYRPGTIDLAELARVRKFWQTV